MAYPFLSDEWLAEARRIREEYAGRAPEATLSVRMNQIITGVPWGDGLVHAHLDTSTGALELEVGHIDRPDVTVTLGYDTARSIVVGGDPQVVLQAFLGGRIRVDGDITKLLELQASSGIDAAPPGAAEVYARIREITE